MIIRGSSTKQFEICGSGAYRGIWFSGWGGNVTDRHTKEAWDALKVMFETRDNAQLLRLMDELSSVKKGGDETIIEFSSRAKLIWDKLAVLGNPLDDITPALRVLAGHLAEYGTFRTVLETNDTKLVMSDMTARLLEVECRNISFGASKPSGNVKSQAFVAAAPKKPFDKKSVVCFSCNKKGHMQRDCCMKKADEVKGKESPAVVVVKAATAAGPTRVPLWPAVLLLAKQGAARLTGAPCVHQPGCSTLAQPSTSPHGIRASPSGRREAGPRSAGQRR